jgi:soluble lytic murein transglycosylase
MAETLRADWLKSLGAREAWPVYLAEYPRLAMPDVAHQCYAYRAEWALGNRSHQREAVTLWFTGRDRPSACAPLFTQLIETGLVRQEDVWRRLRLALDAGNPNVARVVANALPEAQRPGAALFDQASSDPGRLLNADNTLDFSQRGDREIALYAFDQLAKRSSGQAEQALRSAFAAQPKRRTVWARLATWAARRHEPAACPGFSRQARGGQRSSLNGGHAPAAPGTASRAAGSRAWATTTAFSALLARALQATG